MPDPCRHRKRIKDPARVDGDGQQRTNLTTLTFKAVRNNQVIGLAETKFSAYTSMVIVFGESWQVVRDYPRHIGNYGTYQLAKNLYEYGYDVYAFQPDPGIGPALRELEVGVGSRGVKNVAFIGYSWGGQRVWELSNEFSILVARQAVPPASIKFTAYIDAVWRTPDPIIIWTALKQKPPVTSFHLNRFQTRGPVRGSSVRHSDDEKNMTRPGYGHRQIDDDLEVHRAIRERVQEKLAR